MSIIELDALPQVAIDLVQISECVCEQLALNGAGPTCWCGVYPGVTVSYDYCAGECGHDRCGMGYVRPTGVFPFDIFPEPVVDLRCTHPLAWGIEVGALRCFPLGVDGAPPDAQAVTEAAIRQVQDARALYMGLTCCGLQVAPEFYTPVGPAGGCVGGYWTAFLALDIA